MADVRVEVNPKGVVEVMKSPGVKRLLGAEVEKVAKRCNGLYALKTKPRIEPYASAVDEHAHACVGRAFAATKMGEIDNYKHNTMKKGSGW